MELPAIERLKPEDFLRLIEKSRLGKLKIYLGHAAGGEAPATTAMDAATAVGA
jgi:K+-sensing histidine kinase KdpD